MNLTTVKTKNGPFLPKTAGGASLPDRIFRIAAIASAGLAILLTLAFFVQLAWHSVPAFREFGLRFFCSTEWDSAEMKFGAACAIYGTLITTVIALLIAVPTAFLTALFLVEIAPPAISRVFGCALDLLAAIPSVIYGMWGLFVFVPFMQNRVQPFLTDTLHLGVIPLFDGPMTGFGFLTAGIVLALMSLPFMSAIMRDVFRMVPPVVKESAETREADYDNRNSSETARTFPAQTQKFHGHRHLRVRNRDRGGVPHLDSLDDSPQRRGIALR